MVQQNNGTLNGHRSTNIRSAETQNEYKFKDIYNRNEKTKENISEKQYKNVMAKV